MAIARNEFDLHGERIAALSGRHASGVRSRSVALLLFFFAGLLAARASAPAGNASDLLPQDSVWREYSIDDIVISANKKDEIIPSQVLGGKTLQRLNSHSVADALRYFSGVQLKDYGGIGGLKTVNIRSMGSHHVGVFFDGIQIGNAQNGIVDLGRFSLDNMESISVYNGQKSAIFQPARDYASAGSVYMQTRKPVFDSTKKNNLKATVKGGSFKTINPSVLWERRFGEKVSGSLNAEYMYTSGEYKFRYAKKEGYDTTEVRRNGDVRFLRAEAALFGRIDGGEWKTKAYLYDSERGYPGASVREEPGKFRHQDRQWDTNLFLQSSFRKNVSQFYNLLVNGKFAYDYLHYLSDPRLDVTTMYVDNRYRQQEAYVSAANMFTINRWWNANLSVDAQWNKLNADMVNFVGPQRYTILSALATSIRFDKISLQGSLLYTHVTDKTKKEGGHAGDKNEFTPTVMASYTPFRGQDLNFRAFYKRIFRMPTFNDLYYTFIGNTNLDPEYTDQFNLGVVYSKEWENSSFRRLEAQADVYYNEVENKIVAIPTSNQFRWTMLNLGYVEIRGVDVAVQGYWQKGDFSVNSRLTYTYQKAQDFTDPASEFYGDQIPYIPWHSGSLIIATSWRDWDLNYSFIYTGERYEQAANIPENYTQPWYTHDMSLSRNIRMGRTALRVTAEVNNIFNQQYEVVQCYPMPGTNFKIILSLTL